MSDRTQILERIRSALDESGDPREPELPDIARGALEGDHESVIRRFVEEVEAVSGVVHRVADLDAAARELDILVGTTNVSKLVVTRDELARAVSARVLGQHEVVDPESDREQIASSQMGLAGARLAIAEHGTLVLAAEDDRSRFAALLPPHHVAILSERRILGTLAEALAKLGEGPLPADVTFVSGPSRTADIEQILVIGIHGPTRLDILLVADETGSSEA